MSYKILYIEDLQASSIKNSLEREGFEVAVSNAADFNETLNDIELDIDAYIMDYRLTATTGRVDAPTFASTIRSRKLNRPIILITNEPNLREFENDFTNHDTFDMVRSKEDFRNHISKYSDRIKDIIDAYRLAVENKFDLDKVLGDFTNCLDYRFLEKLQKYSNEKTNDVYMFCRTIQENLIRTKGALVGYDMLLARLGVDPSSVDIDTLLGEFEDCKYNGVFSKSYDRWWFQKVLEKWNSISEGQSLRRLTATERISLLNKYFNLNLVSAEAIEFASSTNYWTICISLNKPIDPIDGFLANRKHIEVWEEQDYISLKAILEDDSYKSIISSDDWEEVKEIAKSLNKKTTDL